MATRSTGVSRTINAHEAVSAKNKGPRAADPLFCKVDPIGGPYRVFLRAAARAVVVAAFPRLFSFTAAGVVSRANGRKSTAVVRFIVL